MRKYHTIPYTFPLFPGGIPRILGRFALCGEWPGPSICPLGPQWFPGFWVTKSENYPKIMFLERAVLDLSNGAMGMTFTAFKHFKRGFTNFPPGDIGGGGGGGWGGVAP